MSPHDQKNVVVTGANRGLGLEFVRRFLESGARVVGTAREPDAARELRSLAAKADGRLDVLPLDVADARSVQDFVGALPFERVHVLVNNAGVGGDREESVEAVDFASLEATMRINALGPLRVTQALWGRMADGGKIAHVTSLMGSIADNGSGGRYAYRMSKAALNMAVRSLGYECAARGLTTFAVHPGWVRTDMGGGGAPLSIEESVSAMIETIGRKGPDSSGRFFDRNGEPLPW